MIIKILKIISCSSEHPLYPSSNLLEHPPKLSWRCAKPNELIATVIFQLTEPSCITGLEIGNYRSCFVVVEASTFEERDKWVPVINHQFLSHDEAANNKFRDQVQLFTKQELNPETIKIKFDRVKVTCMQSANPREVFGLEFIILKTEVIIDLGLDIFGRFKLKEQNDNKTDEFKEKYLRIFRCNKRNDKDLLKETISESKINKLDRKQEENLKLMQNLISKKLEVDAKLIQVINSSSSRNPNNLTPSNNKLQNQKNSSITNQNKNSTSIAQTLYGDTRSSIKRKKTLNKSKNDKNSSTSSINYSYIQQSSFLNDEKVTKNHYCSLCNSKSDKLCKVCNLLYNPKPPNEQVKENPIKIFKPEKEFNKLFEDIIFSLSGYVNPQRDEIRCKALKMGAKYIVNPNLTNNKCTHLISCFKNTPKSQQLKGYCKIVSHKFIEDCFDNKKRISWRRYALDSKEQNQPESEEEVEGKMSPLHISIVYEQNTDDSN